MINQAAIIAWKDQAMSLAEPGRIICLNIDVDLWGYSTETQRHIIGEGFDDVVLHN